MAPSLWSPSPSPPAKPQSHSSPGCTNSSCFSKEPSCLVCSYNLMLSSPHSLTSPRLVSVQTAAQGAVKGSVRDVAATSVHRLDGKNTRQIKWWCSGMVFPSRWRWACHTGCSETLNTWFINYKILCSVSNLAFHPKLGDFVQARDSFSASSKRLILEVLSTPCSHRPCAESQTGNLSNNGCVLLSCFCIGRTRIS